MSLRMQISIIVYHLLMYLVIKIHFKECFCLIYHFDKTYWNIKQFLIIIKEVFFQNINKKNFKYTKTQYAIHFFKKRF